MDAQGAREHQPDDLSPLLQALRQAGRGPDRALLDRVRDRVSGSGPAAVRSLVEMAVDERLHRAAHDSPEVWAPLHAIQLLGELEAPEAVEPLLPLFDRVDDDWLTEALPEAFGGIGAPALEPLRALLFDRRRDLYARARAATAISQIGQRHPELRSAVVEALVARLDPAESRVPDDERLNAFVIGDLLELEAVEAAPAIRRAFEEDRVDTTIVDLDDALGELGLAPRGRRARSEPGLRLVLLCTACRYERPHQVRRIYCDLPTQEKRRRGEETRHSEFVIPQRIVCPKCGAVDQYELAGMAHLALAAEALRLLARAEGVRLPRSAGDEGGEEEAESRLVLTRFVVAGGQELHPYEAREMYRQQVAAAPERGELRVRYGHVLRFLGDREAAAEQYRAALRLDASDVEACLNLADLAREVGELREARELFERALLLAPASHLPRETREGYADAAREALAELVGGSLVDPATLSRPPVSTPMARPTQPPGRELGSRRLAAVPRQAMGVLTSASGARKVGRNEPCPCGSGRKYKKCHGR